jgi:hypothetical protein
MTILKMNSRPTLSVHESYIRKADEFFAWGRGLGEYEVGAINLSVEKGDAVTLTDFLAPKRDSVMRARSGCLENGNLMETKRTLGEQVELVATKRRCWLSSMFYNRIKTPIDGHAHNHFVKTRPSGQDIIALAASLSRTNSEHEFAVDTIYHSGGFNIFCFLKHDLAYLIEHDILMSNYVEEWLEQNYSRIHIENYEIIKDK